MTYLLIKSIPYEGCTLSSYATLDECCADIDTRYLSLDDHEIYKLSNDQPDIYQEYALWKEKERK